MKKIIMMIMALTFVSAKAQIVENFNLVGSINGENISFDMNLGVSDLSKNSNFQLIKGDIAYLKGNFPRGAELQRNNGFSLLFEKAVKAGHPVDVSFSFASRAKHDGDYRVTEFDIPAATIRSIEVICDRSDLDIDFPGALNIQRTTDTEGRTVVKANLGSNNKLQVRWKPQLKRLETELAASCDVNAIAIASVGVLQQNNIFTFNVIQGEMQEFNFEVPKDVSITRVSGQNIQNWHLLKDNILQVRLSSPCSDRYTLIVESEKILPALPCETSLPIVKPQDMIRTGGFLMLGTDNALKINIDKAGGLTQIDQSGFRIDKSMTSYMPSRKLYAYQYANLPFDLDVTIDNIVTTTDVENYCVVRYTESEISMDVSLEIDVKDAPITSITAEIDDTEWIVTSISGQKVAEMDSDVRKDGNKQIIDIPFISPVLGTTIVKIKLERATNAKSEFTIPVLKLNDVRNENGYLIVAAEKGIQLKTVKTDNLREIHSGSSPITVHGAQKAYRFKESNWNIALQADKSESAVHCEAFHLISLGEGVSYSSVAFTYHIGGAPIQELTLRIPKHIREIEITGAGIDSWKRDGDICKVKLQTRIMGDYTLLVTYDGQFDYRGGNIEIGGVESVDTESEVGYLVVSSAAALQITNDGELPTPVIDISRDELPAEYAAPVTAPILKSYKYTQTSHDFQISIKPLKTEMLLTQIADYVSLQTKIGSRGGVETTITYFLKNTSRQFLIIKPPAGAKPWHARMQLQDGTYKNIIMQEKDGDWLLPVERPRDPDQIINVQVTYAQTVKQPGLFSSGIKGITLSAPQLPETDAAFAGWKISVPDEYAIAVKSGNMTDNTNLPSGLYGTMIKCGRILRALDSRYYTIRQALKSGIGKPKTLNLTRTVNLADGAPPIVTILVVPNWMGGAGSFVDMMIWSICGIIALIAGMIFKKKLIPSLGIAAILIGISESSAGRSVAAAIIMLIVFAVIIRIIYFFFKKFKKLISRSGTKKSRSSKNKASSKKTDVFDEVDIVDDNANGFTITKILLIIVGIFVIFTSTYADKQPIQQRQRTTTVETIKTTVIDEVICTLTASAMQTDRKENSINAAIEYKFELDEEENIPLFSDKYVILDYKSNSKYLRIDLVNGYYTAIISKRGKYVINLECRIPVQTVNDLNKAILELPENMHNQVQLTIPEKNLNIKADQAVLFNTEEKDNSTVANSVFGNERLVTLSWQPRQRARELEKTVIFAEVNSLATVKPGVLEIRQNVECMIVQGECQTLEMVIPDKMNVTSVVAEDLATWRFDPVSRKLDIVFNKAQTGTMSVDINTQIAVDGLPYSTKFGIPVLNGVDRQRGAVAVNEAPLVQVRISDLVSLSPMNMDDFSFSKFNLSYIPLISKTFRYHEANKAELTVTADKVLPEIRAIETSSMSIADDKFEISSRIELQVTKAGIFDIDLLLPMEFELETLTGKDVSHWDDMKSTNGMRIVKVNFSKRLEGNTIINLLSTRMLNEIDKTFFIPKTEISGARKHTGRITVISEKGVRLNVVEHEGIDIRKAKEVDIYQAGALVFDILRKNWSVELQSEVLNPTIKPAVLQWVDLEEGILQYNAYVNYSIENAGVKHFLVKCPNPNASLTFTGRGIASVNKLEGTNGIWQINLNGKVESEYNLSATWQVPYKNNDKNVQIESFQTIDTYDQRGYLAITCNGRIQVVAEGEHNGLKLEDARNIPSNFGSKDLSDAILCYRTLRPEYELPLVVTRNDAAKVLPAQVNNVVLTTVLSEDKKQITSLEASLQVGDLNFLKVQLPGNGKLWTALVNEKEVSISREGEFYCIPLEQMGQDSYMTVLFSYSGEYELNKSGLKIEVPAFKDLPMRDVVLNLYIDSDAKCYDFSGTMEYVKTDINKYYFDSRNYISKNKAKQQENIQKAKETLSKGEQMLQQGDTTGARKAFEQAYNYSLGKKALNEDARVQLRNISKQQMKVSLFSRRGAVRANNNIAVEPAQQELQQEIVHQNLNNADLNFTEAQVRQIEEELADENDAFDLVADKMVDQQAAASAVIKGLQITLPTHGKHIQFRRDLQISPDSELNVEFKTQKINIGGYLMKIISLLIIGCGIFGLSFFFKRK